MINCNYMCKKYTLKCYLAFYYLTCWLSHRPLGLESWAASLFLGLGQITFLPFTSMTSQGLRNSRFDIFSHRMVICLTLSFILKPYFVAICHFQSGAEDHRSQTENALFHRCGWFQEHFWRHCESIKSLQTLNFLYLCDLEHSDVLTIMLTHSSGPELLNSAN